MLQDLILKVENQETRVRVQRLNLQVQRLNLQVQRLNLRVQRLNIRVQRLNLRVQRLNLRVQRLNIRVHVRQITHNKRTPPPTSPRRRGGETKHSFGGVGFFGFNKQSSGHDMSSPKLLCPLRINFSVA